MCSSDLLEAEDPLVVAQAEGRQGGALDVRVLGEAVAPVLGHHARALLGGEQVPLDASGEQSDIAALSVLSHRVDLYPLATSAKRFETAHHDVVMIDARRKLIEARNTAQALKTAGLDVPLMMVLTEGGMAAVSSAWMVGDVLLFSIFIALFFRLDSF